MPSWAEHGMANLAVKQHQLQWPRQQSWSSAYRIFCRCASLLGHRDPGCGRASSNLSNAQVAACICNFVAYLSNNMRIPTLSRALTDQAWVSPCTSVCLTASAPLICVLLELAVTELRRH